MKSAKILFLNNKVMEQLGAGDLHAGIQDVKRVYSLFNHKNEAGEPDSKLTIPDKAVLRFGKDRASEYTNGRLNALTGRIEDGDCEIAGIKWIGSGINNYKLGYPRANSMVILNDPVTKLPVCIADGTAVSAARTGASGGVAVELFSRKDSKVYTICGAGVQGRTQMRAALIFRPGIRTVNVYDKFPESAQRYVEEVQPDYPDVTFRVITEDQLPEAVGQSDIVATATTASQPFMFFRWVKPGTLLINMSGKEMDADCILKADKTYVDFWESVKHRNSSSIAQLASDPSGKWADFMPTAELGEVINGEKPGRENDEEIIYFNAVGAGVLDLKIVHRCYEKAKKENIGQTLVFWEGDE